MRREMHIGVAERRGGEGVVELAVLICIGAAVAGYARASR